MKTLLITLVASALISLGAPALAADGSGKQYVRPLYGERIPACETDDQTNDSGRRCFVDGRRMFDGEGPSYVVHRHGAVTPITHHRAHRLYLAWESPR